MATNKNKGEKETKKTNPIILFMCTHNHLMS